MRQRGTRRADEKVDGSARHLIGHPEAAVADRLDGGRWQIVGEFIEVESGKRAMANVAELEAGLISERTKAALKAAKARGVRVGRYGAEVLAPKYRDEARQRAKQLEPVIRELQEKGYSRNRIAKELNKRKVPTPRRGRWDHSSVRNVLERLGLP